MRFSSALTAVTSLAAVATLTLVATPAHAQFSGLFNTGVAADGTTLLTAGQTDTHYQFISGLGAQQAIVTNLQSFPYFDDPNSQYIFGSAEAGETGQFILRTTFTLTGDLSSAVLSGTYSTDNSGFIRLNGTAVGPSSSSFITPTDFTITGNFVTGVNILDFVVTNDGGPGSLAVFNLRGTNNAAAAPEPGSIALLGTSVLGVAGMVVRRRRKA